MPYKRTPLAPTMSMPLAWLMALCLMGGMELQAQDLIVRDAATEEPLPYATVLGLPSGRSAVTNERGRLKRSLFEGPEPDDSLQVQMLGYRSRTMAFPPSLLADSSADLVLHLKPVSVAMGPVVVAATRWEQRSGNSPAKVVGIDAREVALQTPQTAADLIGASGQVFVQKSQLGGGSPMIRGFAANRVLIVVDGVRMNNAIFRSGNLQNILSVDPLSVERAEVLFGPGSVRYGSDAVGGVMSFETEQPRFAMGGFQAGATLYARGAYANAEKTGRLALRLSGERWASFSSATFTDYGDQWMGAFGPDDYLRTRYQERIGGDAEGRDTVRNNPDPRRQVESGFRQLNLMQKLRFRLDSAVEVQYAFQHGRTGDVPRYDRLRRPRGESLRSGEWYYGPQIWTLHRLGLESEQASAWYDRYRITLAFQGFEESRIDRDLNAVARNRRVEQVDAFTVNLEAQKSLGTQHQLDYGLEAVENWVRSTATLESLADGAESPAVPRYPDARWSSYGAYAGYGWDPSRRFHLEAAARINYVVLEAEFDTSLFALPVPVAEQDNAALTGNLGFVWRPGADHAPAHAAGRGWLLRGSVGSAFRAPNVDDVGKIFDSEPGAVLVPNPNLEAEYAWNVEASITRVFAETARLDLTAYRTWLQNALVRRSFQLEGQDSIVYAGELSQVLAIQNAAQARVYGVQVALETRLAKDLQLILHWNYQDGVEELDDGTAAPLRHAAPWFANATLRYARGRWRFAAIGQYHAEVSNADLAPSERSKDYLYALDADGLPYSPAWYRIDLRAQWQVNDAIRINLGIENLTHRRYQPYSSGIAGAGFNPTVALRYVL